MILLIRIHSFYRIIIKYAIRRAVTESPRRLESYWSAIRRAGPDQSISGSPKPWLVSYRRG